MKYPLLLIAVCLLTTCSAEPHPPPVVLFAAASTSDALERVIKDFHRKQGIEVTLVFAGSATLARQIEAGAQADLFLSASDEWADFLSQKDMVAERRELFGNRLVAVAPEASEVLAEKPEDLLKPGIARLAVGDPDAVPAGAYARQALRKLGLWERLEPKLVPAADARQALLYVERGEADAGIVYATDAKASRAVRVAFGFDAELTDPIRYPLVLLMAGAENTAARDFYMYLASPDVQRLFSEQGFTTVTP